MIWRTTGNLLALSLALLAVPLLAGRVLHYPASDFPADVGVCDERPCLMGVTLGVTDWEEATALLPDTDPASERIRVESNQRVHIVIFKSVDREHVGRTFLNASDGATISIGWILTWFGEPCGVSHYPGSQLVSVRYPYALININAAEQLTLFSNINAVHWQDPHYKYELQPDLCVDNFTDGVINRPWKGVTSLTQNVDTQ